MLKAGQLLDRFELVCPIGDGGMAHVWAARERRSGQPERLVALKIVHSRFVEDPTFRTMFLDEGRIVAGIDHPNVARVYDMVETKDQLFMVMEYVDGESLFQLVSQYRTAPVPFALKICADACAGLHAAHSLLGPDGQPRKVVHRDVSPQNILVGVNGDVKVIDFGIAHARDRAAETTALGTIKGKIRYMAPEQAKRGEIGPYTDVFGIGATLFRIVVGKPPYSADTDVRTMQALLASEPAIIPFPPSLPPSVVEVIKQAIAPLPQERFATAAALQRALMDVLVKSGERADVAAFVNQQMSEKTKARRQQLAGVAPPDLPAMTPKGTAVMVPLATATAPTVPDKKRDPLPPPPAAAAPEAPKAPPPFMDVHQLVANARNVPDLPVPNKPQTPPRQAPQQQEQPLKIELAHEPSNRKQEPTSNAHAVRIAIAGAALVVVVFLFLVAVPSIAKSRAIGTAREAGFDMTVDKVGVGAGSVTLRGVKLHAIKIPGLDIAVEEIHVDGFSIKELRAVGVEVTLDGPMTDWDMGLALMLQENRVRFAGTTDAPKKYSVANGHVVWKDKKAGTGLEAKGFGADVASRGNGNEDVHSSVEKLFYSTGKSTLGPWGASFETSPTTTRLRVALDPAVPDGPNVLVIASPTAPTQLTVKIGRSSLANLGLDAAELGLPADGSTEIETNLTGTVAPDGKLALGGPTSLWKVKVKDVPKPVDLKIDASVSGTLGSPLDIDKTSTIAFGPFVAQLSGTVTPKGGNVRVDALAKANPLPCATLARAEAKTMGTFGAMLTALGQVPGVPKLLGNVSATVSVKWDSAAPDTTDIEWIARETCGLSIFGSDTAK